MFSSIYDIYYRNIYIYDVKKRLKKDKAILRGFEMNLFAPKQYIVIGDSVWNWSKPIDSKIEIKDDNKLYFKYLSDNGKSTFSTHPGEIVVDKNVYTKKQWSKGKIYKPFKYSFIEKPLHLGLNTLDEHGIKFNPLHSYFSTINLEAIKDYQGYGNCRSYNRAYKVTFPWNATIVVENRKSSIIGNKLHYIYLCDKLYIENIPSDEYVKYIKCDFINYNKGLTEYEKNILNELCNKLNINNNLSDECIEEIKYNYINYNMKYDEIF